MRAELERGGWSELIGRNLREVRKSAGVSQKTVAELLRITFQQYQKYERGQNVISAVKLFKLSEFFGNPVERFFRGEGK